MTRAELRALCEACGFRRAGDTSDLSAREQAALQAVHAALAHALQNGGTVLVLTKGELRALRFMTGEWAPSQDGGEGLRAWFKTGGERAAALRALEKVR